MNEKFKETFREEADELLGHLEDILLELESRPDDLELINAAFRAIHTIKGSAGMFGFEKAGRFTHDLESVLDACRAGRRQVDSALVGLSLRARDKIKSLIAMDDQSDEFDAEALGMMDEFRAIASQIATGAPAPAGHEKKTLAHGSEAAGAADAGADKASRAGAATARTARVTPARPTAESAHPTVQEPSPEQEAPAASKEMAAAPLVPAAATDASAANPDIPVHETRNTGERPVHVAPAAPAHEPPARTNAAGTAHQSAHEDQVLHPAAETKKTDGADENAPRNYRIRFEPEADIFLNGTRVLKLFDELATLGELSSIPKTDRIPLLESLDPESCFVSWDAILTTTEPVDSIKDVFIFVESSAKVKIEPIDDGHGFQDVGPKKLGEILVERGVVRPETLGDALKSQRKLGEVLVERNVVSDTELQSALVEQAHLKKAQERQTESTATSIRVASDKLDQLVDLVGELVTMQARLMSTSAGISDSGLSSIAEQLDRLVSQLRDNAMSMRMLPIGTTFNKFRRVVRDLSAELGKNVELVTVGGETELDKTVIERLNDPLVHIIRNSLDHGLESPTDRLEAGKPTTGTVRLSAEHSGANVVISVSDDGRGMDIAAIKAKAVERGIVGAQDQLSEADALMLIFRPGFSTAKNVTSVSGRGVGMDVVKREIDSLGGSVSVETDIGHGSTIMLKIPLTLAIIDGLLVRVSEEFYVLPLSVVEACVDAAGASGSDGSRLIRYRGDLIPFVDLRDFFSVPGALQAERQIVVVNVQDNRMGLVVDTVIGDNQTVIKPIGRMFKDATGLSGATILGDGKVALIVDTMKIANAVDIQKTRERAG